MRIGIDVRYLSHGLMGGVHAYVINIVPELIRLAADHRVFLYADTKAPFELGDLPPHVTLRLLPWRGQLSSVKNDATMWRQMARDKLDVVHFPANYGFGPPGARTVITLHDQLTIMPLTTTLGSRGSPQTPRSLAMTVYLYACSRLALRRAAGLLTVSEYSRREIHRHSGFDTRRIVVAPSAPAADVRRIDDPAVIEGVRQRYGLARPFIIADALKNPGAIVRAWPLLPKDLRDSHEIVFFSRRPDVFPVVHEAVAAGFARFLLRVPRSDLTALYSSAQAFVFPSLFEGLGLPLVEAMICGAPVIASDRGAIPEVTGSAALIGDAEDERTLAAHITAVLSDPDLTQQLRTRGFARAADFSWTKTARRVLETYQSVVASA